MNSAATLDNMIRNWKSEGHTKAEILVLQADFMLGWPYVWGATGQDCTPEKRQYFMNRSAIGPGDAELIRKRCQILNGSAALCSGCKYYPGGAKTRIQDCQGFMKEICKAVGITLKGGGATSMYNDNSNWSDKGPIAEMPPGAVCLVFKYNSSTGKMDHVGLHIGGRNIIHCSGEVKRGKTSEKGWTHYAIPRGLEGSETVPVWRTTIRKGSRGDDVVYCQDILMALGYDLGSGGADGIFGEKTKKAIMEFQKSKGLGVDGIVGPMTWEALENAVSSRDDGGQGQDLALYTITISGLTEAQIHELESKYEHVEVTKG